MNFKELFAENAAVREIRVARVMESVLFTSRPLRTHMCENPYLTETTWYQLFDRFKLSAADAVKLCSRPLSETQIKHVITKETRERPLVALLEYNNLSELEQEHLSRSAGLSTRVATHLLDQLDPSQESLIREVSLRAGGINQLRWLSEGGGVDEDSARELMLRFGAWAPQKDYSQRAKFLGRLLERFPSLIDVFAQSDHDAPRTAAAGSRFLRSKPLQRKVAGVGENLTAAVLEERKYALLALVNNPVVGFGVLDEVTKLIGSTGAHLTDVLLAVSNRKTKGRDAVTEPFSETTDADALMWLMNRSMPSEFKPTGRMPDLAEIALNPNLREDLRLRAASALSTQAAVEALHPTGEAFWKKLVALDSQLESYAPESYEVYDGSHAESDTRSEWYHLDFADPKLPPYDPRVETLHLTSLNWLSEPEWMHIGEFLSKCFGTRSDVWEVFFELGSDGFGGTLSELAQMAEAI